MSSIRPTLAGRLLMMLAVLVLPQCAKTPGPQASAIPSDVEAWIDKELIATNPASLTMAVAREGRILWARSWGWADKEHHVRATPQTPYIVASVSKSITATALMTLVERGKIDLDAPIETYLGGLTLRPYGGSASDATVRRVLSHTAGLPSFQNAYFADESRRMPPLIDTIRRYGLIVHKPGEKFLYSNLGYSILGHAIATVSGQTLPAFVQREVFEPLGMTRSALGSPPSSAPPAIPYAMDGTRVPAYEQSTMAASSVFASAEDLLRFGMLHVKAPASGQRRILSDGSIDMMQRRIAPSPFGMGWFVFDGRASGVVFHGGGMDGVSAVIFLVPAQRLVVVGLCSTKIDLPGRAAAEIIRRMAPGVHIEPPVPPTVAPTPIPPSLTGEWAGDLLASEGAHRFRLSIDASGQMTGQLDDHPRAQILTHEWMEQELRGSIVADIGFDDVRQPYRLRFHLTQTDADRLAGPVSAWSFRSDLSPDILPMYATLRRTGPFTPAPNAR